MRGKSTLKGALGATDSALHVAQSMLAASSLFSYPALRYSLGMSRPVIGTVDRYIFLEFGKALLATLGFFAALGTVIVMFGEMDEFLQNDASFWLACRYVLLATPHLIVQGLPIVILVAVTFSLGRLARNRELQAMIAGGYRMRRLAWPIVATVSLAALATPLLYDRVVAPAQQESESLMRYNIKRKGDRLAGQKDIWMLGQDHRTFHVALYVPLERQLRALDIVEVDAEGGGPLRRLRVRIAEYQSYGNWLFKDVVVRTFNPDRTVTTKHIDELIYLMPEVPDDFGRTSQKPEEMSLRDLRQMIQRNHDAGYSAAQYEVYYALKGKAFPAGLVILALIGICFTLRPRSASVSIGFGISLLVAFGYYGVLAFCVSFAEMGLINASFSVWIPNLLLGIPAVASFAILDHRI